MRKKWKIFWHSFALLAGITDSIILLDLQIPPFVREGDTVKLVCVYDLEYDGLYSVKWYKNDIEFYSYIPKMSASSEDGGQGSSKKRFFDLPGVYINVSYNNSQFLSKSLLHCRE